MPTKNNGSQDFLSQFSGKNSKPDSFKEEVRTKIEKPKFELNKKLLIIIGASLVVLIILIYLLFFAPKIKMQNFVYKTKDEAILWIKQQEIEATGVIFDTEYNFDYDEGTILSQNIETGRKIRKNAKLTFTVSAGPDPDEEINFPDIESMDKTEVKEWIASEKLLKTKISTSYSESVEADQVISYSLSGCEEDSFTRSCSLKINVSKGPAPAGTITVEDFIKKNYSEVEAWASTKKITLTKNESFSDSIASGLVMSQSVTSGKTMKEGEELVVVVSKGKAIKVPDFSKNTVTEIKNWATKNGASVNYIEKYDKDIDQGKIISQDPKKDSLISSTDFIDVYVSKGKIRASSFTGTTKQDLRDWVAEANEYGADLELGNEHREICDDPEKPKDTIIRIEIVGNEVKYYVSRGMMLYIIKDKAYDTIYGSLNWGAAWGDGTSSTPPYNEAKMRALCKETGITYEIKYVDGPFDELKDVTLNGESVESKITNNTFSVVQDQTLIIEIGNTPS